MAAAPPRRALAARAAAAHWPIVAALALAIAPLAAWATAQRRAATERAALDAAEIPQEIRAGYARSDRCQACHPAQYHSWRRGYHRSMTTYASPQTVHADFDRIQLEGGGYGVRLSRLGDGFFAEMVDPLWIYQVDTGQRPGPAPGEAMPQAVRRISMVTGSHHMQAFWMPSTEGNSQMSLPFTYLLEDRRWVPRGDVFLHPPDSERHPEQVWNVSCIRCHSTGGQPLALGGGWKLDSRVAELGIACEACHGPAEAHVAANRNPLRRYALHLRGGGDPTIVNPARLPAARAAEVCGQCHSLSDVTPEIELGTGKTFVPGDELARSQPLVRPLQPTAALAQHLADDPLYLRGYFWSDGTIRVSSRDFSGMIESRCNQGGRLWCGSCHSLHEGDPDLLLAPAARGATPTEAGDGACLGCHPALAGEAGPRHAHHRAGSPGARCVSCHMPYTVYGLLKGIRQHRIDSPRVTGDSGRDHRPNACNLCHVDRGQAWAAAALARWYRQPVPAALAAAAPEPPAVASWLLSGDAILRALAAWHLGWDDARAAAPAPGARIPYLLAALDDPYAAVRYVAARAIRRLDPTIQVDYLAEPEARARVAAPLRARWLAETPPAEVERIQREIDALRAARDDTPVRAME